MRKILIISYFFPPCNLTASQRTLGWARYLTEFGYYPIIVTRNWEHPINNPNDLSKSSGNAIIHEKHDGYEVYYLPYKANLRDSLHLSNKLPLLRKALTALEIIFQYMLLWVIPFRNIYYVSKQLLRDHKDIKLLIVTANPFISFRFGYLLNKQFGIKWLADYRDDWNTDELRKPGNIISSVLKKISSFYEKKWVGSAAHITSVSQSYADKINRFTSVSASPIFNGFFEEDMGKLNEELYADFTITYNGSLYASQPVELFITVVKSLIDKHSKAIKLKLCFVGTGFDPVQKNRILSLLNGYEQFYEISNRISHEEIISIQKRSHLLLMIAHAGIKGIPSSKIYEYIALKKPVIVYPSDQDIIESTLSEAGTGIFPRTEEELLSYLQTAYQSYLDQKPLLTNINENQVMQFSRKASTEKLAQVLDNIIA